MALLLKQVTLAVDKWWVIRVPVSKADRQCETGALHTALKLKTRFAWTFLSVCDCVHGECNSGVTGNRSCTCYGGYTGPRCDQGKRTTSRREAVRGNCKMSLDTCVPKGDGISLETW